MKIHIAIGQYEFVEEDVVDAEEAVGVYQQVKAWFEVGEGLPKKEFDAVVDTMIKGGSVRNGVELWGKMNPQQQEICQTIKRSCKRINSRLEVKE